MSKSILGTKKRRGRPTTTGTGLQIGIRWHADDVAKIDAYAKEKRLERSNAIRELVRLGLIHAKGDDE